MKIYLLIYVIQGVAAHVPPSVERVEEPTMVACRTAEAAAVHQLRVDKCVEGKWCDAPFLVRTACVEGS